MPRLWVLGPNAHGVGAVLPFLHNMLRALSHGLEDVLGAHFQLQMHLNSHIL